MEDNDCDIIATKKAVQVPINMLYSTLIAQDGKRAASIPLGIDIQLSKSTSDFP